MAKEFLDIASLNKIMLKLQEKKEVNYEWENYPHKGKKIARCLETIESIFVIQCSSLRQVRIFNEDSKNMRYNSIDKIMLPF